MIGAREDGALGVDDLDARRRGGVGGDRDDLAVADDDGGVVDLAVAGHRPGGGVHDGEGGESSGDHRRASSPAGRPSWKSLFGW